MKNTLYFRKEFSKNLRHIMEVRGKKQVDLITDLHLSKASVSSWFNGSRLPRMDKLDLLATYLNVRRSDLMGESEFIEEQDTTKTTKGVSIPVLGEVAAGIPIDAIEYILDWEEIPLSWDRYNDYFALKIKGDSMAPRMESGDVVIVRQQPDADNGDTVIVLVGETATCKKIRKTEDGIVLISTNPNYTPMLYTWNDVDELPVTILGKVVELRQKY